MTDLDISPVPDEVRKRYRKYIDAGGSGMNAEEVLEYMGEREPVLNDMQRSRLRAMGTRQDEIQVKQLESRVQDFFDRRVEKNLQKGMTREAAEAQARNSGLYKQAVKQLDRTILKNAALSEIPEVADRTRSPTRFTAEGLFKDERPPRRGLSQVSDTLRGMKENRAKTEAAEKAAKLAKQKATANAMRKAGLQVIKGGLKALTPVAPYIGALGWGMDAYDAYGMAKDIEERDRPPPTEEQLERTRRLVEQMRNSRLP